MEKELRRRSVTRLLLWEEYRAANPDGFGYTWFCTTFDAWKQRAQPGSHSAAPSRHLIERQARLNVEIVKRSDKAKGFVVLPKRWVVERTFA